MPYLGTKLPEHPRPIKPGEQHTGRKIGNARWTIASPPEMPCNHKVFPSAALGPITIALDADQNGLSRTNESDSRDTSDTSPTHLFLLEPGRGCMNPASFADRL